MTLRLSNLNPPPPTLQVRRRIRPDDRLEPLGLEHRHANADKQSRHPPSRYGHTRARPDCPPLPCGRSQQARAAPGEDLDDAIEKPPAAQKVHETAPPPTQETDLDDAIAKRIAAQKAQLKAQKARMRAQKAAKKAAAEEEAKRAAAAAAAPKVVQMEVEEEIDPLEAFMAQTTKKAQQDRSTAHQKAAEDNMRKRARRAARMEAIDSMKGDKIAAGREMMAREVGAGCDHKEE